MQYICFDFIAMFEYDLSHYRMSKAMSQRYKPPAFESRCNF